MSGVFDDLDATLKAVLADPAAPAQLRAADVAFDTPDRDYRPAQATLNLYLHDIAENRMLRDDGRVMARTDTGWTSRRPPMRLDCSYLVTAWSADTGALRIAQEHRLLGLALTWLSRFPVVDDRFLQGGLRTPPQPFPLAATVAQTREGQVMGQFWTALGTTPRPAFSVTATIAVDPFDDVEQFAAVASVRVDAGSLTDPVLAGRVLDQALNGVAGAGVAAVGTAATATTDPAGAFALPGLAFGTYTLRVRAPGAADQDVPVPYGIDHQFHDVILPPP